MKIPAMLCLVFLILFVCCAEGDSNTRAQSKRKSNSTKNANLAPSFANGSPNNENKSNGNNNERKDYEVKVTSLPGKIETYTVKDRLDKAVSWGTIILTVVGVIGTFVAIRTLYILREHAKHFGKLAEATQQSVEFAKNGDRAWLLVSNVQPASDLTFWEAQMVAGEVNSLRFTFDIRNVGKTPAFIYSIMTRYDLDNSRDNPPRTDIYHARNQITYERILPQAEHCSEKSETLSPSGTLSGQQFKDVHNRAAFLWAYGVIFYRDIYERAFYTRFCYRYDVPPVVPEDSKGFRMAGDSAWNKAT